MSALAWLLDVARFIYDLDKVSADKEAARLRRASKARSLDDRSFGAKAVQLGTGGSMPEPHLRAFKEYPGVA